MFFPIPTTKYTKIKFWKLYARQGKKKKKTLKGLFLKNRKNIYIMDKKKINRAL